MKLSKTVLILVSVIIILIIAFNISLSRIKTLKANQGKIISDTTYIHTVDTISINKPVPYKVEVIKTIHDTLPSIDSIPVPVIVNIPISQKSYSDTIQTKDKDTLIYNAYVSGYKPNLDSLNLRLFKTSKIITNTPVPHKKRKWSIGPNIGVSYDGIKVRPTVGIGIQYSIISW